MRTYALSAMLVGFALTAPVSRAQAQTHVYNLNGTYADVNGGPPLVPDGGTLSLIGYTFGPNQGLSLSNVLGSTSYSLVFRSYLTDITGFRKLIDFKDRTIDPGYYNLSSAAYLYPVASGPPNTYMANVLAVTVLTRDAATSMFTAYVNGIQQFSANDGGIGVPTGANGILRFFEDDFATGQNEASGGFVNYIATYDRVLTSSEVANLPFGTTVPEPATLTLLATGLSFVFGAALRKRKAQLTV